MTVEIRVFGPFRDVVGRKHVTWPVTRGMTVDDLLTELVERHPAVEHYLYDDDELVHRIAITKNKAHIGQLEGVDTVIEDGDTIRIAPPVSGGGSADYQPTEFGR
ncbi:MoaD/ThiS family protein [Natrarchaeobius halalkaliphilus]|uniref:MoaD/ThiS family protein n=1 Tax=Natrarchaeobius halalkaliphilus TaxID=1679091 RepID=A0A3N6LIU2_9EURY|nr:ubiquitin-like small modifier protein 1 [Natrarchaeobius halalkaliphilus]RQG87896.1 MoaD/ThiS family protein [Natrarchaeobius halalkaliphilus]